MKKLSPEQRESIVSQAIQAGDLMTEFDYERMPVALLTGAHLDWVEEHGLREQWANLLQEKGMELSQFNSFARAAVKSGLLLLAGKETDMIGGFWELLKPLDFDERVASFLNPDESKPKQKQKNQQAQSGLFK